MIRIVNYILLVLIVLFVQQVQAQQSLEENIKRLELERNEVQKIEKNALKEEIKIINERLNKGELTEEEAQQLKEEAARKRALNIENRLAIIDNQIALLQRGEDYKLEKKKLASIEFMLNSDEDESLYGIRYLRGDKPLKYDKRTKSEFMMAFGFNNAIIDGSGLNDSPYDAWNSRFFELGWVWTTRVLENSNAMRFRYGLSFQFNGLSPKDNRYFVDNEGLTELQEYPIDLKKVKLRSDNLVIPLHFEFGPSKVTKTKDYIRYSTYKQFKFGIGGYAGLNISSRQKLKYEIDGKTQKDKIKKDYNTSDFVYGLSSYIGKGDTTLYFKYDLSPLFNDNGIDQKNISMGIRFDL